MNTIGFRLKEIRNNLNWRIANSENADMVRLSFLDACERYSVPAYVYLDNGRGFTSLMLSGGAELGKLEYQKAQLDERIRNLKKASRGNV